jgi:hypothetical protein
MYQSICLLAPFDMATEITIYTGSDEKRTGKEYAPSDAENGLFSFRTRSDRQH